MLPSSQKNVYLNLVTNGHFLHGYLRNNLMQILNI